MIVVHDHRLARQRDLTRQSLPQFHARARWEPHSPRDRQHNLFLRGVVKTNAAGVRIEQLDRALDNHLQHPRQVVLRGEVARHVVQRGEFVGAALDFLPGALALGDVADVQHDCPDRRVVQQVIADGFQRAPGAVFAPHAKLSCRNRRPRILGPVRQRALRGGQIVRVNIRRDVLSGNPFRQVAEYLLRRWADVTEIPRGIQRDDNIRSIFHQRAESLLARAQRGLRALALSNVLRRAVDPCHTLL